MRLRLWRHDLELRHAVTAASEVHSLRPHLFLEVEVDGVRGLGEISPPPRGLNGDPGVDDVALELEHFTLRHFLEATVREGATPHWARISHFAGSRPASAPASALLEMAILDAHLRGEARDLDEHWPPRFATPVQATVSLLDPAPWPRRDDVAQLRAKVSPRAVAPELWRRLVECDRPVVLDFNCSALEVRDVEDFLATVPSDLRVVAVEQPFAPGNVIEHARLAERIDVPVSLDEGVRHRRDLEQIVRYRAAHVVCVKPARVGGPAQARTMIERARELGLGVYVGGFFESPLARAVNRALAHHLVSLPSDIGEAALDTDGVVTPDSWGCGYRAGPVLESTTPLVNLRG